MLAWLIPAIHAAVNLKTGSEYYIVFNIYDKLLGSNKEGDAPALSALGTNSDADSYIWVAEDVGDGYCLLKQKSSGKYLAASTSDHYNVVFHSSRSTDDAYCWHVGGQGADLYLRCKRNTGARLGIDGGKRGSKYVSVYYDKHKGSHASFRVVPVAGKPLAEAQQAYVSDEFTNSKGVREIDYIQLKGQQIDRSDAIDIHITDNTTPIVSGSVNLGSDRTWLVFDNVVPSKVINSYLKYVTIRGEKASRSTNCRVGIYLNGAVVIPLPDAPFTGYTETNQKGDAFPLQVKNHKDLGEQSNMMRSFVLRRGYMATLATSASGWGYSRVYVADHADLKVNLPTALDLRVTSVNVKKWEYLSKKGWADAGGETNGPKLRATWFWSWGAGYNSSSDMEYVPCRQHLWWPSAWEVNSHTSSAAFSINEPEHGEQHSSDRCSCGGTVNAWTCTTLTPDFIEGGGRIGSPQPTDFNYLYEYFGHVDDMSYRCDFAVTHAYWATGGASYSDYANWFCNLCRDIYWRTGRPVWLTELEVGASWNDNWDNVSDKYEANRGYLQTLLEYIDDCPEIERYAIYDFDSWFRHMFWDGGELTPAGEVYRDHRATFAYDSYYTKEPVWYAPSIKKPFLIVKGSVDAGFLSFEITNDNTDMTKQLLLQRSTDGKQWKTIAEVNQRSLLEDSKVAINDVEIKDASASDLYRVSITDLLGNKEVSSTASLTGLLANPNIEVSDRGSVPGWTCHRHAQSGYAKSTGDTYLEVWDENVNNMSFDYYQELTHLKNGVYELKANVFNSTNGVSGASVGGEVGLYALTSGHFYFAPVLKDSELDTNEWTTLDKILVKDGKLRLGIRSIGQMKARWAGADNFRLNYLGEAEQAMDGISEDQLYEQNNQVLASLMEENPDGTYNATRFMYNAEAQNGDAFGWTASMVNVKTGESYDGDKNNRYFDMWDGSSYSSSMKQVVDVLPSGLYTVSAMVRSDKAHTVTLSATNAAKQTVSASFAGEGDQPSGAKYTKWKRLELEPIEVGRGESLTIELNTKGTSWWSADNFVLTWKKQTTGVAVPSTYRPGESSCWYDLQGRKLAGKPVDKGLYIMHGKKVLIKGGF